MKPSLPSLQLFVYHHHTQSSPLVSFDEYVDHHLRDGIEKSPMYLRNVLCDISLRDNTPDVSTLA